MISNNIKSLRQRKNLSQSELAKVLNVSQQTIGSWEVGRAEPDTAKIMKLADFFGVSTDYLLGYKVDLGSTPVAAHMDDNLTEEQKKDIADYIEFKKAQYKKENENKNK